MHIIQDEPLQAGKRYDDMTPEDFGQQFQEPDTELISVQDVCDKACTWSTKKAEAARTECWHYADEAGKELYALVEAFGKQCIELQRVEE
jgi:hypothetical protein